MEKILATHQSWESLKDKIKEANTSITDSDLDYPPGSENELYNHLAGKLHKSADEVKGWVESLAVNKSMAG